MDSGSGSGSGPGPGPGQPPPFSAISISIPPASLSHSLSSSVPSSPPPASSAGSSGFSVVSSSLLSSFYPSVSYFTSDRHLDVSSSQYRSRWTALQRDIRAAASKSRTVAACLCLALNLGVDPPDCDRPLSSSRGLCWLPPSDLLNNPPRSLESLGAALQSQYEQWQPKARYRQALDPTPPELKSLLLATRKACKGERILFHFNGLGVPRPSSNGELWLFNRNYTQYIPVSIVDIGQWIGGPALFVIDCAAAGRIVQSIESAAAKSGSSASAQRDKSDSIDSVAGREESSLSFSLSRSVNREREESLAVPPPSQEPPPWKDIILLCACGAEESLPRHPDLPADLFTACLLTPLRVALRWFALTRPSLLRVANLDLLDLIPGKLGDRKTPLGELNWIFTAITDTIAWHSLPRELFQSLFRGDLLLGSLFRNFLLAERIFKSFDCSPVSVPALPPCHKHFLWSAWDSIVESFLLQLDKFLKHSIKFSHSSFFAEHLSAFEVWLEVGREESPPPLQLPIVLQVLLSQNHRRRALVLLARFLGKGSWAVNEALGVGILPYVLKLLQSPAAELREVLVFIWTKILSVSKSCQSELLKENNHQYFVSHLADSRLAERQRVMSAFVLTAFINEFPEGQAAILNEPNSRALSVLSSCLDSESPNLRRWTCLFFAKFWQQHEAGRVALASSGVPERIAALVADPIPEVRAACLFAMQCWMSRALSSERQAQELQLAKTFAPIFVDASPLVRLELILALAALIEGQLEEFCELAAEKEVDFTPSAGRGSLAIPVPQRSATEPPQPRSAMRSPSISSPTPSLSPQAAIRSFLWRIVRALCHDPFPAVSRAALTLRKQVGNRSLGSKVSEMFSPALAPNSPEQAIIEGLSSMGLMDFSLLETPQPQQSALPPASPAASRLPSIRSQTDLKDSELPVFTRYRSDAIKRVSSFGALAPPQAAGAAQLHNAPLSPGPRSSISVDSSITSVYQPAAAPDEALAVSSSSASIPSSLPPSSIFERSCEYFAAPQQDPILDPSDSLIDVLTRDWRALRNGEVLASAASLPSEIYDVSRSGAFDQTAVLQCGLESVSALLFHPFENLLVCGDSKRSLTVWDYASQERVNQFSNENSRGSKLSSLRFLNESLDRSLLLAGSDDGVVRIWKNFHDRDHQSLVTAWLAVRNLQRGVYPGLILDWQPVAGRLIASGNTDTIRVWDVEREICIAELTWEDFGESIFPTSITSSMDGNSLFAGFIDGAMRSFDLRTSDAIATHPHSLSGSALPRHSAPVVGVHLQRGGWNDGKLLSAALNREIHCVDLRYFRSEPGNAVHRLQGFEKAIPLDCFACHDFAPLFATGSRSQIVRIADQFGSTVSTLKFHKGFMGHRIGPVTAMAFHPTKLILASASINPFVSIMTATGNTETN